MKMKLNKFLEEKIIFIIHCSQWVSDMVLVRNKNGETNFCIDLKHINKELYKYNYLVPTVEHILSCALCSKMLYMLDDFLTPRLQPMDCKKHVHAKITLVGVSSLCACMCICFRTIVSVCICFYMF